MVTLIVSILIVVITVIPQIFTVKKAIDGEWYKCNKPTFTPPNYVFPIVWTLLYAMLAYVLSELLSLENTNKRTTSISLLLANLLFGILWTESYFGLHNIPMATVFAIALLLTSLLLFLTARDLLKEKWKSYIIVPYILWLTFALAMTADTRDRCAPTPIP